MKYIKLILNEEINYLILNSFIRIFENEKSIDILFGETRMSYVISKSRENFKKFKLKEFEDFLISDQSGIFEIYCD